MPMAVRHWREWEALGKPPQHSPVVDAEKEPASFFYVHCYLPIYTLL